MAHSLTVQDFLDAYEQTGLKPLRRGTLHGDCACPLTALYFALSGDDPFAWNDSETIDTRLVNIAIAYLRRRFRQPDRFWCAFLFAIDKFEPNTHPIYPTEEAQQGYNFGMQVRAALWLDEDGE